MKGPVMDHLTFLEQLFAALFTLTVLLGSVLLIAGVRWFFEWAAEYLDRKMDEIIAEWADHE
jgi:hypothetical protein